MIIMFKYLKILTKFILNYILFPFSPNGNWKSHGQLVDFIKGTALDTWQEKNFLSWGKLIILDRIYDLSWPLITSVLGQMYQS